MKTGDLMTRTVVTVPPDASILQAIRLMMQNRISGLPVVDAEGVLVGIVTEGDFLRRREAGTQKQRSRWIEFFVGPGQLAQEYVQSSGRKVHEVMSTELYTATEDTPADEIVSLMERRRIKRVPVLRDGKVVGIVTRANLLRALPGVLRAMTPESADDAAIREQLLAELASQRWAPVASISVTVRDGIVRLSGALSDERQRAALRVAAENIPGVRGIEDDLVWVEPMTGMTA